MQQGPDLFRESTVGELDSSWNVGTSDQSFSEGSALSRPSGPVITTGALPVATEQPTTFFTELPPPEPAAWANFPAPLEQPQVPGSTAQLDSSHQYGQHAQEQPAPGGPEAVLKQLEEYLKADNSPEVSNRILAMISARGTSAGMSGPLTYQQAGPCGITAPPVQPDYNASSNPASAAASTSSLAGSYPSHVNLLASRPAQQRASPSNQLQPSAPGQLRHSIGLPAAEPNLLPRGMDPYAWPASIQAVASLHHIKQPQHFIQRPSQLQQQLPPTQLPPTQLPPTQLPDSTLQQERLRTAGPQPLQGRRGQQQVRQTGAVSLQQQIQERLPRQEEPEPFEFSSYLPSSSAGFPHSLSRSANAGQPPSVPQALVDPWQPPTRQITQRPDLQRNSTGSSSGQEGSRNALTSPFDNAAGSQSMTQALLEAHAFHPLPVNHVTAPFGNAPHSAQQAPPALPVAGRLPVTQPAPLSTGVPNLAQAAHNSAGSSGRQPPSVLDPRLSRPAAPPQRAPPPPPESRAMAVRQFLLGGPAPMADDAAASRAQTHPMFQSTSEESSGGSCGLAASAAQAFQFPPITSQVQSLGISSSIVVDAAVSEAQSS